MHLFFLLHSLIDSASLSGIGTVVSHSAENIISILTESLLECGTHSHLNTKSRSMTHPWQFHRSVYGYSASSEVCHAIWFLCCVLQVNYLRLVYIYMCVCVCVCVCVQCNREEFCCNINCCFPWIGSQI